MSADGAPYELTLTAAAPANGGSCVARHDGRVVFVRYALPGETVRVRITGDRGSFATGDVVEVIEPSADRIDSLCPIAGPEGSGCCDLAFAQPAAALRIKGAIVANQLARLGNYEWCDEDVATAEPVGEHGATGYRTRVRLAVSTDGRAGFHRYHSDELAHRLNCAQLPVGMLDGVAETPWPAGAELHVAVDDDAARHIVVSNAGSAKGAKSANGAGSAKGARSTEVVEGGYEAVQRVGSRRWQVPETAFWQAHREAAALYSSVVAEWAQAQPLMMAEYRYGRAGVVAAALAQAVGDGGHVMTVDTSRGSSRSARAALADLPQVSIVTDSVRRALGSRRTAAGVAVLDPPRTGAGRDVIGLLAAAGVPRIVHIGCEAASFARDVGLYQQHGYAVERLRVFDSFPLTHHVECIAVLQR